MFCHYRDCILNYLLAWKNLKKFLLHWMLMAMAHLPPKSSSQDSVSFGELFWALFMFCTLHINQEEFFLNSIFNNAHMEPDYSLNIADICSRGRSGQIMWINRQRALGSFSPVKNGKPWCNMRKWCNHLNRLVCYFISGNKTWKIIKIISHLNVRQC